MANVVWTLARPADVRPTIFGNKKVKWFDLTSDTGDYVVGGKAFLATDFGLRHIDEVTPCGSATQGTAGAGALGVGVRMSGSGTTATVQLYEAAATGLPFLEKTAEPMVANFNVRLRVIGT